MQTDQHPTDSDVGLEIDLPIGEEATEDPLVNMKRVNRKRPWREPSPIHQGTEQTLCVWVVCNARKGSAFAQWVSPV